MANPVNVTLQLGTAVANGIAEAQSVSGAENLTLNGSLVSGAVATLANGGLTTARRVLIASTGSDASVVFTVYGTDRYGNAISESVTGVTSTASQFTQQDFATVTRIAASGATAGNITAGTNGVASSPWFVTPFTPINQEFNLGIGVRIASGSATYTVEYTYDDPCAVNNSNTGSPTVYGSPSSIEPTSNTPPVAWPDPSITSLTQAMAETNRRSPCFAWRLTVNSGTGTVQAQGIQVGA